MNCQLKRSNNSERPGQRAPMDANGGPLGVTKGHLARSDSPSSLSLSLLLTLSVPGSTGRSVQTRPSTTPEREDGGVETGENECVKYIYTCILGVA